MRRVRFRKNTIFRIYLTVLFVVSVSAVAFLLSMQARFHRRQVSFLETRLSELETRLAVSSVSSDSPFLASAETQSESPRDLFWVEGSGRNRKWWYTDVVFLDGYRARYYLHLPIKRRDLVNLHKRLSHDSIVHYWEPEEKEDDFGA